MSIATPLTRKLGIVHPLLLAPMDYVSDARLTSAVTAAGGFGILGGGYGDREWLVQELDRLGRSGTRYGVGFITWSLAKQPHLLDITLERRPAAMFLSFGDVAPFARRIHDAGALLICQVQTLAMARKAIGDGADILVAQGTEAGGHGASRGLFTLLPEVVDAAGAVPVVAAGGIADGRGLAAALALGAAGALLGTRMYATEEAAAPAGAKQRVLAATGDDTQRSIVFDISRRNVWPPPFNGRCLKNSHLDKWLGREVDLMRVQDSEAARYAVARETHDFDVAAVIAGEASGLIHDIPRAADLIERIMREAGALAPAVRAETMLGEKVTAL